MYNFTLSLRTALLGLFLSAAATLPSTAQNQMQASNYYNNPFTTYNTVEPDKAVDQSLTTAATLTPLVVGGSALRVGFGGATVQQY